MPIKGQFGPHTYKLSRVVEHITKQTRGVQGQCLECVDGKLILNFPEAFYKKYGGQMREVLTLEPCKCGSHLWMIKVPPKLNILDDVLGENDDNT